MASCQLLSGLSVVAPLLATYFAAAWAAVDKSLICDMSKPRPVQVSGRNWKGPVALALDTGQPEFGFGCDFMKFAHAAGNWSVTGSLGLPSNPFSSENSAAISAGATLYLLPA